MENFGLNFDTTYTMLPKKFFSKQKPDIITSPEIVIINNNLGQSMGLDFSKLNAAEQGDFFSGNRLPEGSSSFSQAYAGHQFGHFTMLGDGRAHICGEHIAPNGKRLDIQFKGSGRTPYSRGGDGKAALGPMLREYIISEAMHNLGVPTTRSLAVVATGESIIRERILPGAILTRVASSHIRVGTFEFAAYHGSKSDTERLLNYTIQRHYPNITPNQNKALEFIKAVMERQIDLIVNWMRVGFVHGVINTDNMAISGETIDYGPCAFIDSYDPSTVFSSIDHMGRYAFDNQPRIAQWNLGKLAEALLPLIDCDINKAKFAADEIISQFPYLYEQKWLSMMRAKLGLFNESKEDAQLISDLLNLMHKNHMDYTNTFRDLSQIDRVSNKAYNHHSFEEWLNKWRTRKEKDSKNLESSVFLMQSTNPVVIPRNHKVEQALEAANRKDLKPIMCKARDLI